MTNTQKKNQKPIELDMHLRYRCPKLKCGYDHWISLRQAKTKNFKIVCDCGNVFRPKQIAKIKVIYNKISPQKRKPESKISEKTDPVTGSTTPDELKKKCVDLLVKYGFTKEESCVLIDKAYLQNKTDSASLLIKFILQNLETLNDFS